MTCPFCRSSDVVTLGPTGSVAAHGCETCGSVGVSDSDPVADYGGAYFASSYLPHEDRRKGYATALLGRAGGSAPGVLVDLGCGAGLVLDVATEAGWLAVGVDRSAAACRLARGRGHPVTRADAAALPLARGAAAMVLALDVVAHVDDPAGLVADAAAVLEPGGLLIVKTPNRPRWAYRLGVRLPRAASATLLHLPHQRWAASRRGLAALLLGAGFQGVTVRPAREALRLQDRLRGQPVGRRLARAIVAIVERAYGRPSWIASGRRRCPDGD